MRGLPAEGGVPATLAPVRGKAFPLRSRHRASSRVSGNRSFAGRSRRCPETSLDNGKLDKMIVGRKNGRVRRKSPWFFMGDGYDLPRRRMPSAQRRFFREVKFLERYLGAVFRALVLSFRCPPLRLRGNRGRKGGQKSLGIGYARVPDAWRSNNDQKKGYPEEEEDKRREMGGRRVPSDRPERRVAGRHLGDSRHHDRGRRADCQYECRPFMPSRLRQKP